MRKNNPRALVTGGCGFVGRNITRRLCKNGSDVWIVDNLSTGLHPDQWLGDDYERLHVTNPLLHVYQGTTQVVFFNSDARIFFSGDIPAEAPKMPVFNDVFHLAAVVGGRAVIENDPIAVAINLALDASFYNWAICTRPKRLLYASSSAAYPVRLQSRGVAVALHEDDISFSGDIGQPDMSYGWSKLTGEYLGRLAARHYGLHVTCIRPFSGYGEDQGDAYPVPAIAGRAAKRDDPLVIWGSGNQGRDFIHIDDCVDAAFLALDRISDGSAVNLGSGQLTTFYEAANIFSSLAGYSPVIKPLEEMPTGMHSRYADISLSEDVLRWKPSVSLQEGFGRVLRKAENRLR